MPSAQLRKSDERKEKRKEKVKPLFCRQTPLLLK
jgi:hypothetical protein